MDPFYIVFAVIFAVLFLIEFLNYYGHKKSRELREKQYTAKRVCPQCDNNDVWPDDVSKDNPYAVKHIHCNHCGFSGGEFLFKEKTVL